MRVRYCSKCGNIIKEDVEVCPNCSGKCEEFEIDIEGEMEEIVPICKICGVGRMNLLESSMEVPVFVCSQCGAYFGEFLKTGKVIYYNTLHMKIGRIILTEVKIKGSFRVSIKKMEEGMLEEGISEIAKSLEVDLGGYSYQEILDALYYLVEEGVINYTIEDMENSEDFCWFSVSMEVRQE